MDPFLGSGTTCRVAQQLQRNSIGIEINKDYIEAPSFTNYCREVVEKGLPA